MDASYQGMRYIKVRSRGALDGAIWPIGARKSVVPGEENSTRGRYDTLHLLRVGKMF